MLIREFAAQALRTLVAAGELKSDEAGDFDFVNRPGQAEEVYTGWLDPVEDEALAPEGTSNDEEKYYFGIDIGPYWLEPLGRTFGLTREAIERRARHLLRTHMGWNGGGWQQDARLARRIFGDGETHHSHGSMPKIDDLRAYHGYHAMMLAAAVLLKERPVRRRAEETMNEFSEWLLDHLLTRADGRWLADRRDPRLVVDPPPPENYVDKLWHWSVTADYLDQKLVTDDGFIVFWGHWTGGERDHSETISIRSALVSRTSAEALVSALQTAPELGRFVLPSVGVGENLETELMKLKGWVTDEHVSARLDEGDPWAEGLHYPGPAPSAEMIAKIGLTASAGGRIWTTEADGFLRSETWTCLQGYGRERETIPGWRLSGDKGFLKCLLGC